MKNKQKAALRLLAALLALTLLEKEGELVWKIGEVISGGEGVELW